MLNSICIHDRFGRISRRQRYLHRWLFSLNAFGDSEKIEDGQCSKYKWDIDILNPDRQLKRAVALLDTQCQKGNLISSRMLERLDVTKKDISPLNVDVSWSVANGQVLTAAGLIRLEFKRAHGTKYYECDFFVVSSPVPYDVIFGTEFIDQHGIFTMKEDACLVLIQDKKPSASEQQQIAFAKEEQRKMKAEREARQAAQRNASQQIQTQQGQSSASAGS